jgi:copper chaperone
MSTLKFNTTLKCSGCVNTIKPNFDNEQAIQNWEVDLNSNPKVLTVETDSLKPEEIQALLQKSGYKGDLISEN